MGVFILPLDIRKKRTNLMSDLTKTESVTNNTELKKVSPSVLSRLSLKIMSDLQKKKKNHL